MQLPAKRQASWILSRSGVCGSGFALVATVTISVLLVMVALALLSLASISSREKSLGSAQAEAQANARLALMLAIGELQKNAGLDTRITASSQLIDPDAPALVGVWKSWEGTDHDSTGRPIAPEYDTKRKAASESGRFLGWLVSGAEQARTSFGYTGLASKTAIQGTVQLLAEGTLGDTSDSRIYLAPRSLDVSQSQKGAYVWWISGENQKARLAHPHLPRNDDVSGWTELAKSHATPDPTLFGLADFLADPEDYTSLGAAAKPIRKAVSRNSMHLLKHDNTEKPHQHFHDYSSSAIGLLTNVATGGWRKDMSILTEKWDDIYDRYAGGRLPLFRYKPEEGKTSLVPKPTLDNYDASQSGFYPWSEYIQYGQQKYPMTYNTAVASWQSLVNFATKYKSISYDSVSGLPSAPIGWGSRVSFRYHPNFAFTNQDYYGHYHEQNLNPVLARVQFIIQAQAFPDPDPNNTSGRQNRHRVNLRIIPIYILWNPYNVEIVKSSSDPEFGISALRSTPLALSIINGTFPPANEFEGFYKLLIPGDQDGVDGTTGVFDVGIPNNYSSSYYGNGLRSFTSWLPYEFTLKPGEAKIFSPERNPHIDGDKASYYGTLILKEGYDVNNDFGIPLGNPDNVAISSRPSKVLNRFIKVPGRPNNDLHATDQLRFHVKADRLAKMFTDAVTQKSGAGAYFAIGTTRWGGGRGRTLWENGSGNTNPNHIRSVHTLNVDRDWARKYWPSDDLVELSYSVSELVPGNGNPEWTNLYSVSFGPRLTFGAAAGSPQNRPTKGFLQSSPFVDNSFTVPEQDPNFHPVNAAFDISYHSMSINGDLSPEVGSLGYISTGFQIGDGLSRFIAAELPLRPMASLVELQSWNLRGHNPFPPFQYNLIGNSEATPLVRQDGILVSNPINSSQATNLQHDDAYCANHLLFDDWFFSSITPDPATFGDTDSRSIETVYRDYLQGTSRLTNRAYLPIVEDSGLSSNDAEERVDEILNSPDGDGWLKVASRIEVEGMFNVNSTSLKAWRALLGHVRNRKVAYYTATGVELDEAEHDHVISRHTVAANVKAGADQGIGAQFPHGSEYTGFRTLSDDQLDELAEQIVEQVRQRGPFLSLSEFVNRQLSSNESLALAGALQTALNSLSDDPMSELKDESKLLSAKTIPFNDAKLQDENGANVSGYAFEKAAEGYNTHGFPGWIRQADVLRPIAPVLSARDDTFTIRTYGDARDSEGNILARAWCEAIVKRTRSFVDSEDAADSINSPSSQVNKTFGRKYAVVSFRWLNEDEV